MFFGNFATQMQMRIVNEPADNIVQALRYSLPNLSTAEDENKLKTTSMTSLFQMSFFTTPNMSRSISQSII